MITVIDLKIGNIASVSNALTKLKIKHRVSEGAQDVDSAEKIIFPGVGNFAEASKRINAFGLKEALTKKVVVEKTPLLGICLGMQLLADYGEEGGGAAGLGFIKGKVVFHRASPLGLRLPHIGWNEVVFNDFKLFEGIENRACFYFVHSYEMVPAEEVKIAQSNYGVDFIAAVQKNNIFGIQFHPEKSQDVGLRLLKNFCEGKF